ncbi:MAG: peptidase S9, partial [Bacteroidales bacterium]|nr:peptidase S9 [Bacteroidales bacterium]
MGCNVQKEEAGAGYIGPSDIKVEDGRMTPEVMLSLGRLSDPQLSPDGEKILYGVSYTSIAENRSCRNLFTCNLDGTGKNQLTTDGKSINAAKWAKDGHSIYFLQGGQLYNAVYAEGKLGERTKLSDVAEGISDYALSPDNSQVFYVSTVPSAVKSPKDSDPGLDKAQAYVTEDLMYRHWDHWVTELPHTFVAVLGNGTITKDNSIDILGGPDVLYELPLEPYGGAEQL